MTDYATPTPKSGPHGIVVAPDGAIWYTANAAGKLGRLDPATGQIHEYPLAADASDPHTPLVVGGKVWFTVQQANRYGVLDPATGQARIFAVPTPNALPYGIVAAPDGMLWIALFGTMQGHIWYSDYARGKLGMYDPSTGSTREFPCVDGDRAAPYALAITPDGRIWYAEAGAGRVVAFDPKTQRTDVWDIPTKGSVVRNMSVDAARSRIWLALSGIGRLGRIDYKN